jgi:hypothetical protein
MIGCGFNKAQVLDQELYISDRRTYKDDIALAIKITFLKDSISTKPLLMIL